MKPHPLFFYAYTGNLKPVIVLCEPQQFNSLSFPTVFRQPDVQARPVRREVRHPRPQLEPQMTILDKYKSQTPTRAPDDILDNWR